MRGIIAKRLVWLSAAASLAISACAAEPTVSPAKAIFVLVDGIPADVIERVDTPNLDAIAAEGGYTRAWVGGEAGGPSESPTVSAVGYNSLLTGTWANKHNVYDNAVEAPNYAFWDVFRIAKHHDPTLHTALFSTWLDNRTRLLGDGLPEAGGHKLDYYFDGFEHDTERFPHDDNGSYIREIDEHVAAETARYLAVEGPDLSWVYLEYPDWIAHSHGDGERMDSAVRWADGLLGPIRQAVETRRERHGEDWLILVTTDHGRDADTGRDHGGQSPRERRIWIVTNSGRLNARFHDEPPIVDILPSITSHLGLAIPADVSRRLDGRSFID